MNNKNIILAVVVVIIVAAVAIAAWQMSGDDDDKESTDVSKMADSFADNMESNFGDFYVEDGATAASASVMTDTGSDRMPHSKFTYTVADDASTQFASLKSKLDAMTTLMGTEPKKVTGVSGFDDISIVQYDVRMGTMSVFTMVYFAAYDGNVLIDGTESAFYHSGSLATEGEVSKLFKGIADSLTCSCTSYYDASAMAEYMDDVYSGGFGDFYVDSGATTTSATAMTDTGSSRLSHSTVKYTVANDAASQYKTIKASLDAMEGFMGAQPVAVTGIEGFEEITVYKMDVVMGTMATFTLVYFVAYDGNVLIDGSEGPLYHNGSLAEDSAIKAIFNTISKSVRA